MIPPRNPVFPASQFLLCRLLVPWIPVLSLDFLVYSKESQRKVGSRNFPASQFFYSRSFSYYVTRRGRFVFIYVPFRHFLFLYVPFQLFLQISIDFHAPGVKTTSPTVQLYKLQHNQHNQQELQGFREVFSPVLGDFL